MPLIPLIIAFSINLGWAQENYIAVMGAGGEPQNKETTIFDAEIKNLGKFFKKDNKWNLSVSLNGGHDKTEEIISQNLAKNDVKNLSFIEPNFNAMIADYEGKISRGEIATGDQLVLYISTHGAQKTGNETSHQISFAGKEAQDLNTLSNASTVSLDKLQNLIDLANKHGVKLGILDFSCHSGNALNLANDKTCIISASGPNHFGYTSWGHTFSSKMKKGKNLEEVFLETLSKRSEPSFPMISSPIGKDIQNEMYPLLGRYLNYWKENPWHEKLTKNIENEVEANRCEEVNEDFRRLNSMITALKAATHSSKVHKKYDAFLRSLGEYHSFLDELKKDLIRMNLPGLKKEEEVCFNSIEWNDKETNTCTKVKISSLLKSDFEKEIESIEVMRDQAVKDNKAYLVRWARNYISQLKESKVIKEKLLAENPGFNEYMSYYKDYPKLKDRTWDMASDVAKKFREIYLEEYDKGKRDSRPNPCREIVL